MSAWQQLTLFPLSTTGLAVVAYRTVPTRPALGRTLGVFAVVSTLAWNGFTTFEPFTLDSELGAIGSLAGVIAGLGAVVRARWPGAARWLIVAGSVVLVVIAAFVALLLLLFGSSFRGH